MLKKSDELLKLRNIGFNEVINKSIKFLLKVGRRIIEKDITLLEIIAIVKINIDGEKHVKKLTVIQKTLKLLVPLGFIIKINRPVKQ